MTMPDPQQVHPAAPGRRCRRAMPSRCTTKHHAASARSIRACSAPPRSAVPNCAKRRARPGGCRRRGVAKSRLRLGQGGESRDLGEAFAQEARAALGVARVQHLGQRLGQRPHVERRRSRLGERGHGRHRLVGMAAGGAQHVERHDVARAFPDGVERRFAEVARQRQVLGVAVAAQALERFVDELRRALAHQELHRRRQQAHVGCLARIVDAARSEARQRRNTSATWASSSSARSATVARIDGWSASRRWNTERLRMWFSAWLRRDARLAGRGDGAVEPRQVHHLDDGAHARALGPTRSA